MSSHGTSQLCPEAILRASPSRVRWEIKSRSICAEREKANANIWDCILFPSSYFSFTVSRMTFFNIHAFSILITSINLLPKREISDTINVSPFFILFNSTPSFLSLADRVPETVSSTHTSIWKSLCLANDLSRTAGSLQSVYQLKPEYTHIS